MTRLGWVCLMIAISWMTLGYSAADQALAASLPSASPDPASYPTYPPPTPFPTARPPANLTLTPDSGPANSTTLIKGTGFTPGAAVFAYLAWDRQLPVGGGAIGSADAQGNFQSKVTVPNRLYGEMGFQLMPPLSGPYQICAEAGGTGSRQKACAQFVVTAGPKITLSADAAPPGSKVTIRGSGFPASTILSIYIDTWGKPPESVLATPRTDAVGAFQTVATVPKGWAQPGAFTVTLAGHHSICADSSPTAAQDAPYDCARFVFQAGQYAPETPSAASGATRAGGGPATVPLTTALAAFGILIVVALGVVFLARPRRRPSSP